VGIAFPPEVFRRIVYATYDGVHNVRNPLKVDRKRMPWLSLLQKQKDNAPLAGANGVVLKYKLQSNLDIQGWERKDTLQFNEQNIELDTQFPWANIHEGWEIVHDDLEAMGYTILPNQARGKNFAKLDSESDAFRLVDYLKEGIESMMDKMDVNTDQVTLRDNSANPKLPQGLDAYWPVGVAPGMVTDAGGTYGYYNLGSVGGKLRSQYPDVLQHFLWLNATYGAAGSLRIALNYAKREAELRSRGRSKGGIRAILAGSRALDKYVKFATVNNTNYTTSFVPLDPNGVKTLDIGIPDSGLHFEGVPIVHCPTFEILDRIENPTFKWTDRMVMIDPESFGEAFAPGKENYFSAPMDEGDTRVTRLSLDSKMVMLPKIINANTIVHVGA
jgi:hypothetical protein